MTMLPPATWLIVAATFLSITRLAVPASAQTQDTDDFVEEAVREAEKAQQADETSVDRMSEEARRAAEEAPSGEQAVGTAPTDPKAPVEPGAVRVYRSAEDGFAGAVTGGYAMGDLVGHRVLDRQGAEIGTIRDLVIGATNLVSTVMIEFAQQTGGPGKITAVGITDLTPVDGQDAYTLAIDRQQVAGLPSYRQREGVWQADSSALPIE